MAIDEMITQGIGSMTQVEAEYGIANRILGQQNMQYFIGMALTIIFFYLIYKLYKYLWEPGMKRARYTELYELWKLGDALKDRGLTFEKLDEFEAKMFPNKKNQIEQIDAKYAKEKEPKK